MATVVTVVTEMVNSNARLNILGNRLGSPFVKKLVSFVSFSCVIIV